jgi:hypothetical protein
VAEEEVSDGIDHRIEPVVIDPSFRPRAAKKEKGRLEEARLNAPPWARKHDRGARFHIKPQTTNRRTALC